MMAAAAITPEDVDRAALWLYLATEDAVRTVSAGDAGGARRRLDGARLVARGFVLTGVVSAELVDGWAADSELALAARGGQRLAVGPWWSAGAGAARPAARSPGSGAEGADGAVTTYLRWLASTLLAGWPRPHPDAAGVIREVADAFRYAGVVGAGLATELETAVKAVAARRSPPGWPTPPRGARVWVGRVVVDDDEAVLTTGAGTHRVAAAEGRDDGWVLELVRMGGFLGPEQPVWVVDDRSGLYFGTVEDATADAPSIRLQPALQASATVAVLHVGVSPAPATARLAVPRESETTGGAAAGDGG